MNTIIYRDSQIYNSVPLIQNSVFCAVFDKCCCLCNLHTQFDAKTIQKQVNEQEKFN